MAEEFIRAVCSHCQAKYKLPVEAQGRVARCKRCGEKFEVPRKLSLEDSVLTWLTGPVEEDEVEAPEQPKVISMPQQAEADGTVAGTPSPRPRRGLIPMRRRRPRSPDPRPAPHSTPHPAFAALGILTLNAANVDSHP